ncbi:tripartite tricarboxylate transporter TctB family protein [Acidovorax sp. CCYZU-2555]|uniref:tripartite tricarboxylate transporter TctB family protein n=1 Tax=Acidovorax sp. CCYZU-2555 TaxID=2835042 RepID=UPI001BCCAE96|nr:tripartite tricarboxylate transporter TctB family protein [Acidovorax sp. CCYZU-2555]
MKSRLRIRNEKDFGAGCIYLLAGAGFSLGALGYRVGDASRMGPGWFPLCVGLLLVLIGILVVAQSVRPHAAPETVKRPDLRSLAWVLGAVVLFGLLLQPAGLVIALVVLVVVSSRASHEFTWRAALINSVLLTLFSIGVFVEGIHLSIGLWPEFLG